MGPERRLSSRGTPRRQRKSRVAWRALAFGMLASACAGNASGAAEAHARAAPHVASFAEFDAWARRVLASEREAADSEALHETLFAPLFAEPSIVEAWVRREGVHPHTWAFRGSSLAIDEAGFVLTRDSTLGEFRTASRTMEDLRQGHEGPVDVVVIERTGRPSASSTLRVTIAFTGP